MMDERLDPWLRELIDMDLQEQGEIDETGAEQVEYPYGPYCEME